MSLPEIVLTLDERRHMRAAELVAESRSRYLASAAKWSRDYSDQYNEMIAELVGIIDPTPPAKPSTQSVIAALTALGIRQDDGKS